jgi:alpha-galactosidase
MHKVCEAITTLSKTQSVGLCHGVWMGMEQVSYILDKPVDEIEMKACGINGWAHEFCAKELDWFYYPGGWASVQIGKVPEYVSVRDAYGTERPFKKQEQKHQPAEEQALEPSGELAIPIMESIVCGKQWRLDAVNIPNFGWIPNLPDRMVVEVPATSDVTGLHPKRMRPLPEPIAAVIRLQGSINKLLVEAFAEESKSKLQQAVLLEPTVTSYHGAMEMVDEMQRDILPPLH